MQVFCRRLSGRGEGPSEIRTPATRSASPNRKATSETPALRPVGGCWIGPIFEFPVRGQDGLSKSIASRLTTPKASHLGSGSEVVNLWSYLLRVRLVGCMIIRIINIMISIFPSQSSVQLVPTLHFYLYQFLSF